MAHSSEAGLTASSTEFPTRTLRKINGCDDVDCERWAVPMTTAWTALSGCPEIISSTFSEGCEMPHWANVVFNSGYYSPGLCMSGYTVASGCVRTGIPSMMVNGEPVTESETAAFCVPPGFVCGYNPIVNSDSRTLVVKWAVLETQSAGGILTEYVPAIQIRWKSEDLQFIENHPLVPFTERTSTTADSSSRSETSAPASSETSASTVSNTSQATPTDNADSIDSNTGTKNDEGGLSRGAIAGIIVGVVVAVALVCIAAWLCIRRRNRRHTAQEEEQPRGHTRGQVTSWTKSELEAPVTAGIYSPGRNEMFTALPPRSRRQSSLSQVSDLPQLQARFGSPFELALGNDMEVAGPPTLDQMPVDIQPGLVGGAGEGHERQQLLQRRQELAERRATLELERIEAEERVIEHRLSQLPGR